MTNRTQNVDELLLRVVKVLTLADDRPLTNATGFFYQQDGYLYLVTARHVILNSPMGPSPDHLLVSLHRDARNLCQTGELRIPLYVGRAPQWFQHFTFHDIDVVAVEINDPNVLSDYAVSPFRRDEIVERSLNIPLGQEALIVGFPLGFHDTLHHLPIVRGATIASSFSYPFKGENYFLTDSRLHRGMSGSPVIARIPRGIQSGPSERLAWGLLGIHTSSLDVSDRDPVLDERLALNTSWYADLLTDMLPDRSIIDTAG